MSYEQCWDDGGVGLGAGHRCRCVREPHHTTNHGCQCGAIWKRENTP